MKVISINPRWIYHSVKNFKDNGVYVEFETFNTRCIIPWSNISVIEEVINQEE